MRSRTWIGVTALALLASGLTAGAQVTATNRLMRDKLLHSQKILEALTTSNYGMLTSEAEALSKVVASPQWDPMRTPEFRGYTEAFSKATQDLLAASEQRDLDVAAARYGDVIAACYNCHRYRKSSRIALR